MAVSLGTAIFLASCATSTGQMERVGRRAGDIQSWAMARGFVVLATDRPSSFDVLLLARDLDQPSFSGEVTVYIEGDGAPWLSPFQPPPDPTPLRPLALGLAAQHNAGPVLYFARPCQYQHATDCDVRWWTSDRFAPEVVQFYQQQLDWIKVKNQIRSWRIVGHSGGGVLAMVLASQRDDVRQVITIASPVDVQAWVDWHGLTPLPLPLIAPRPGTDVLYLGGGQDQIVPPEIVGAGQRRFHGRQQIFADFDHECCWLAVWPSVIDDWAEKGKR